MTPESRNQLKDFIKSEAGIQFLQTVIGQEVALEAEATSKDATTDRQIQLFNKKQGIYWVRTLINDLIDTRNGK
jgi:hypothetical protein